MGGRRRSVASTGFTSHMCQTSQHRVLDSTREAVAIRQRAAVDVGVLLSGGVEDRKSTRLNSSHVF